MKIELSQDDVARLVWEMRGFILLFESHHGRTKSSEKARFIVAEIERQFEDQTGTLPPRES